MQRSAFLILLLVATESYVSGQQPIPSRPSGFTFGQGRSDAGVQIDMFIDLLCPDSRSAHSTLKKVVPKYQPTDLRLVHHLFPLPYHHNAFSVAQAAMTVAHALHPSKFQVWMETMYNNQEIFYNTPTASQSQIQVTQQLKSLAMKTFPELTLEQWNSGMSGHGGTKMDVLTRTAWKYACSRGVTGTPIFFINGVPVSAQSDWSVQQWIELLDPLIQENRKPQTTEREIQHTSRMLEVTKRPIFAMNRVQAATERCMTEFRACEFMNETSMCCNATEYCILRQGCVQK